MMRKGKIRLWAEGEPGIGKRLLLDKIATILKNEGLTTTTPTLHPTRNTWFIDVHNLEETQA